MTLWLIGMMGAGKTSAGRQAAEILDVEFIDTDNEIAARMGCSIAQLWGDLGEAAFRDLEQTTVQRLAGRKVIVGTGGGVVLSESNRLSMSGSGVVVWLTASPAILAHRVGSGDARPLLVEADDASESLTSILEERERWYAETADVQIDTSLMTVDDVAEEIAKSWPR